MPFGLPLATSRARRLWAKASGAATLPPVTATCMVGSSAVASTSAGAPALACWANVDDAPKLKLMAIPGWAAWNCRPISLNASVNDEAASTVIDPLRDSVTVGCAFVLGGAADFESLHAASTSMATATRVRRRLTPGAPRRPTWT
jgi:hypothetical protein